MNKHIKFVLFLGAMALIAVLIFNLKKEADYGKEPEVKSIAEREFLGIKLLDIFLGVIGLAFVGVAASYVASLVKGAGKKEKDAAQVETIEEGALAEEVPPKKLALERALGRTGANIAGVILVIVLIAVVLAMIALLFAHKLPFLRGVLEKLSPAGI